MEPSDNKGAPTPIYRFAGEFRFLSNFWPAMVDMDGYTYSTVEHAYQAAKTTSHIHRLALQRASTPGSAKRIGSSVPLRPDWEQIKISVMENLVRQKFTNDGYLRHLLWQTGDRQLFEGNHWGDRFWGVCAVEDGGMIGENHLGKIIMKVREEIKP